MIFSTLNKVMVRVVVHFLIMAIPETFANRRIRIAYLDGENSFSTTDKYLFERAISNKLHFGTEEIRDFAEPILADILIVNAAGSESQLLVRIVSKYTANVKQHRQSIWVPALFIGDLEYDDALLFMKEAMAQNWYFDIVNRSHFDSLPIRIANLVRIHDHLRELLRYQSQLDTLEQKAKILETELDALKK